MRTLARQQRKVLAFRSAIADFLTHSVSKVYLNRKLKILCSYERQLLEMAKVRVVTPWVVYQATLYLNDGVKAHLKVMARNRKEAENHYGKLGQLVIVADIKYLVS